MPHSGHLPGLIGPIYDAAMDPACWQPVLDEIATICGGKVALALHDQKSGHPAFLATANWEEDWAASYLGYYSPINPWTANLHRIPVGGIAHDGAMVPRSILQKSEFHADWLKPQRLQGATVASVFNDDKRYFNLSVMHETDEFKGDCAGLFRALMPHLQRPAQMARQLSTLRLERDAALEGLNRADTWSLVLRQDGQVAFAGTGALALLTQADGIAVRRDRIQASSRDADLFMHLVSQACLTAASRGTRSGGAVALKRSAGRPLSVLVCPFFGPAGPAALVFLRDSETVRPTAPEALRSLFGLTPAEAELAARLADGESIEAIAQARDTSLNTVRAQLKSLMSKTGTRRQSELIVLMTRSVARMQKREP